MKAWMRLLTVELTSTLTKQKITFGDKQDDFSIKVNGTKYLSCLKDSCVVTISNLSYTQIVQLTYYKFTQIEVKAGYRTTGSVSIFKGYILSISPKQQSKIENEVYLLCTSKMLGLYNDRLINLSLNSGINMYSALSFIGKYAGIPHSNISESFKNKVITRCINTSGGAASIIEQLVNQGQTYVAQTDNTLDSIITIWDVYRTDKRVMELRKDNIIINHGYPTLSSEGLTLYVLPTFNFMPGDVIKIDNAIIDISTSSIEEVKSTPSKAVYMDEFGEYMIYQVEYSFENRGETFELKLTCKKKDLLKGVVS